MAIPISEPGSASVAVATIPLVVYRVNQLPDSLFPDSLMIARPPLKVDLESHKFCKMFGLYDLGDGLRDLLQLGDVLYGVKIGPIYLVSPVAAVVGGSAGGSGGIGKPGHCSWYSMSGETHSRHCF